MNNSYDMPPDPSLPFPDAAEDSTALAGAPLAPGTPVAQQSAVVKALRTVYDPEIPVNIYDMGLIYGIDIGMDGNIAIDMSLTSPACPVAGTLPQSVADAAVSVTGVGEVTVNVVWDPPWTPERMSEDARLALGMD